MRQKNDKDTDEQSNPQVNNANPINPKSLRHKNMVFKDAVVLLTHMSFRVLLHHIVPDSILNVYNSTGQQRTSNCTLKDEFLPYT